VAETSKIMLLEIDIRVCRINLKFIVRSRKERGRLLNSLIKCSEESRLIARCGFTAGW
jgi:hypothetical protein